MDYYYVQDANFNVTAVVENDGTEVERYLYSPYGQVTFLDDEFDPIGASAIGNTHLYTGRERDPETGLQLNRNRFYAAHLGRWVNRDPIGYRGSPYNLYEYVSTDPLGDTDSRGTGPGRVCVDEDCKGFGPFPIRKEKPKDKDDLGSVGPGECKDADGVGDVYFCTDETCTDPTYGISYKVGRICTKCTLKASDGCTAGVSCKSGRPEATISCDSLWTSFVCNGLGRCGCLDGPRVGWPTTLPDVPEK